MNLRYRARDILYRRKYCINLLKIGIKLIDRRPARFGARRLRSRRRSLRPADNYTYGVAVFPGPSGMWRRALPGSWLQMRFRQALPAIVVLRRTALAVVRPHPSRARTSSLLDSADELFLRFASTDFLQSQIHVSRSRIASSRRFL